MKRHCLVLPASERWEYPEDAYSRLDFASPPFISSSLGVANGVECMGDEKNVQTLWWAELRRRGSGNGGRGWHSSITSQSIP